MIEIVQLHFKTPVHLGRGREELDKSEVIYHSDSLKSAIFAVGRALYPDWDKNCPDFFNSFRISSCFPFCGDEFFLPKPKSTRKYRFEKTPDDFAIKKGKKIEFLSMPLFFEFCRSGDAPFFINDDLLTPDGGFLCSKKETFTRMGSRGTEISFNFYRTEIQQRVKVTSWESEKDEETKPFYIDRLHFEKGCGLYFLAEYENDQIRSEVLHAVQILGELGIGTDRTVGNGLFECSEFGAVPELFNNRPPGMGFQVSLGLFIPKEEEINAIDLSGSQWSLMKRGGYMAGSEIEDLSHLRKKSIYMFSEGSIFHSEIPLRGKMVNLKPEYNDSRLHDVWRDGQCLMIKI